MASQSSFSLFAGSQSHTDLGTRPRSAIIAPRALHALSSWNFTDTVYGPVPYSGTGSAQ